MRKWLHQRKRAALMNRVLRGDLVVMSEDTSIDVARFSYVDKEHVTVSWKIHDYFESINGYFASVPMDAHVEFVATLDEAAQMLDYQYFGPFTSPVVDNTYTVPGKGQVPLNLMEAVNDEIVNRSCRLIVESAGRCVSVMTVIPKTNSAHAMITLREQAQALYRANLENVSLSY